MKKIITKAMIEIFAVGMVVTLILNFALQVSLDIKRFQKTSAENFCRLNVL